MPRHPSFNSFRFQIGRVHFSFLSSPSWEDMKAKNPKDADKLEKEVALQILDLLESHENIKKHFQELLSEILTEGGAE